MTSIFIQIRLNLQLQREVNRCLLLYFHSLCDISLYKFSTRVLIFTYVLVLYYLLLWILIAKVKLDKRSKFKTENEMQKLISRYTEDIMKFAFSLLLHSLYFNLDIYASLLILEGIWFSLLFSYFIARYLKLLCLTTED